MGKMDYGSPTHQKRSSRSNSALGIGKFLERPPWSEDDEDPPSLKDRDKEHDQEKRLSTYGTLHAQTPAGTFALTEDLEESDSFFGASDPNVINADPFVEFSRRFPFIIFPGLTLPPRKELLRAIFNWQTLKVVIVLIIFVFTLWLFTTASTEGPDAEKAPNHAAATSKAVPLYWNLDHSKSFALIDIIVVPQQIDKVTYQMQPNY